MRDVELEAGEVPPPGDPERIISGAYEALDREYITNKFVGQNGARNLRDGLGFLRWVDSFFDVTKDDAQINMSITRHRRI